MRLCGTDEAEQLLTKLVSTDTFYVTGFDGQKVVDADDLQNITLCLRTMLEAQFTAIGPERGEHSAAVRPGGHKEGEDTGARRKSDLLYSLMDRRGYEARKRRCF